MSLYNGSNCSCDPVKRIVQKFLQRGVLEEEGHHGNYDIVCKLHMFHKSSVLRLPISRIDGNLQCKVMEDTLKSLVDWFQETQCERAVSTFNMERAKKINVYDDGVSSVKQDSFGNVTLELNLDRMKGDVISWFVTTGWLGYSKNTCHNQIYRVEIGMTRGNTITAPDSSYNNDDEVGNFSGSAFVEYRKILVAQAISSVLKKIGHQVDENSFTCLSVPLNNDNHDCKIKSNTILVAATCIDNQSIQKNVNKSEENSVPEAVILMNVGSVFSSQSIGVQDMLSKRLAEIREISESRRLESLGLSSWATSLDNLARATLHYDLLYRPLETDIQILSLSETGQMNNDALFIMYNYSRILSILKKFSVQVESGEYPQLPIIDEMDFSRICTRKEELHLLHLVMEWPRIMESTVNFLRFQINLAIIFKYLLALAKAFNSFYFQIVVLVPPNASHNFSAMMARIYLIKAICSVFEDCLDILQLNHANSTS